jgi:hypothetical protein
LRKFPFFNACVTELVDKVVDYRVKLVRMILLFLLPRRRRRIILCRILISPLYMIDLFNQILDFVRIGEYEPS